MFGEFGFDCHHGNCYLIPNEDNYQGVSPGSVIMIIGFTLPCIIILISYGCLWFDVWRNHNYLKNHGSKLVNKKTCPIFVDFQIFVTSKLFCDNKSIFLS